MKNKQGYPSKTPLERLSKTVEISAAKNHFLAKLKTGDAEEVLTIIQKYQLPKKVFHLPQVELATKIGLRELLKESKIDDAIKFIEYLNLSEDFTKSVAKTTIINKLKRGYIAKSIKDARRIMSHFNISEDILYSPEVIEAAKSQFLAILEKNYFDSGRKLLKTFNWSEKITKSPEVVNTIKNNLVNFLRFGRLEYATEMIKKLKISEDILNSPEVQSLKGDYKFPKIPGRKASIK